MDLSFLKIPKPKDIIYQITNLDPDNIKIQGSLARVLISMGVRMEEAMKLLKEALEIDPDNPILLHMYGWGYFRMEEYTLAKDYLLKAENLYTAYNHNLKLHLDKTEEILVIHMLNHGCVYRITGIVRVLFLFQVLLNQIPVGIKFNVHIVVRYDKKKGIHLVLIFYAKL